MEEIPNQNQNCHVDQVVRRMKLREYFDPTESQSYTRISAPLDDNVSLGSILICFNYYLLFMGDSMRNLMSFLKSLLIYV